MTALAYTIFTTFFIIQAAYSQCVNRVVQGPNGPIELLPNQVLIPSGVPYLGPVLPPGTQGRPVMMPGPSQPCKPTQPVVLPTPSPIPAEYNMGLQPVMANVAPPTVQPGNVILPNVPSTVSNIYPGNVYVPNLAPGNMFVPSGNMIVPSGNMIVPSGNMIVPSGNMIVPNAAPGILPVSESYAPNVIHDNSVANSLANALQLLVVSNLLGSTLPDPYNYYDGYMPGYNYLYK